MNQIMFNKLFMVSCVLVSGVTTGQDLGNIRSFVYQTEKKIAEDLSAAIENSVQTRNLRHDLQQFLLGKTTEWSYLEETEFDKVTFAPGRSFGYVYGKGQPGFAVNRNALNQLLTLKEGDSQLLPEVSTFLRELTRTNGELILSCLLFRDFSVYWVRGASNQHTWQDRTHHLYDTEGRVNPLAIFGLFAEHTLFQQKQKDAPGFHEWLNGMAIQDGEYTELAKEAQAFYPQEMNTLLGMMAAEATWSAIWYTAKEAMEKAIKKTASAKHMIDSVNRVIEKMRWDNITPEQQTYLLTKYDLSRLTEGMDVPEEKKDELLKLANNISNPKKAAEKLAAEAEQRRQLRIANILKTHLLFYELMDEPDAWKIVYVPEAKEHSIDKKMREVTIRAHIELQHILTEHGESFVKLASKIHNQASADAYADELREIALKMRVAGFHMYILTTEFDQVFRIHSDMKFNKKIEREYEEQLQSATRAKQMSVTFTKLWDRHKRMEYYGSEKLKSLYTDNDLWKHSGDFILLFTLDVWKRQQ